MEAEFKAATTQKHMATLNHDLAMQLVESCNGCHALRRPKRRDLSNFGRVIHQMACHVFNDGMLKCTKDTFDLMGMKLGRVTQIICAKQDAKRNREAASKLTVMGKGKRKKAKSSRQQRDKAMGDTQV